MSSLATNSNSALARRPPPLRGLPAAAEVAAVVFVGEDDAAVAPLAGLETGLPTTAPVAAVVAAPEVRRGAGDDVTASDATFTDWFASELSPKAHP